MLKFGIVGAGRIATDHANALLLHTGCELAAVADIHLERAEALAKDSGAKVYSDYKLMCGEEDLDAVIINLPHYLHCEAAVFFLEHKVSVMVEKPMAMNVNECNRMISASKESNAKLAVGHLQRFFPCYDVIKEIIASGKYGKLCMFTEVRNIDYFTGRPEWFLDKKRSGGGITMNFGAHTLDKLLYVTGLHVNEVFANATNLLDCHSVEACSQILLRMENGVSAQLTYCGCHVPAAYETVFYFTNGAARISDGRLWVSEKNLFIEQDVPGDTKNAIYDQLCEFVKFLHGEECNIATAEFSKEIIEILDRIFFSIEQNAYKA